MSKHCEILILPSRKGRWDEGGNNNSKMIRGLHLCEPLRMNSSEQRIKSNTRTVPSTEEVANLASVGEKLLEREK